MSLTQTFEAHVIGATRYKMDNGASGARIVLIQDAGPDNDNRLGKEVMNATAPYEIFEKMRALAVNSWPQLFVLQIQLKTISTQSGPRAGIEVISVDLPLGRKHDDQKQNQNASK